MIKRPLVILASVLLAMRLEFAPAHDGVHWTPPSIGWATDQIEDVLAFQSRKLALKEKTCFIGSGFYFKVRDEYAFDIDEAVSLQLELRPSSVNSKIRVVYDGLLGHEVG